MTPYIYLNKVIRYSFLLVFTIILGLVLWGLNKGFDITDEGYYILGYQKGQEIGSDIRNFHIIIKKLFFWLDLDIINIRALRLVLTLLSSALFAFALKNFIKKKTDYLFLFFLIAIGSLLSYGFGPQSLSYNTLTSNFLIISTSFLILGINNSNKPTDKINIIYHLLNGFFLALCFFVKPPAGILAGICFLLYYLINYKSSLRNKSISLSIILTGFVSGLLFYFIFCQSFNEFYNAVILNIEILTKAKSGHDTSSFINNLNQFLFELLKNTAYLSLFLIIYFFIKQKVKKINSALFYISISLLAVCFLFFFKSYLIIGPMRNATPYLIILIAFGTYIFIKSIIKKDISEKITSTLILLFLLPVIGAFGTNNALISNCMYMLACWTALIAIFVYHFNIELDFKGFFLFIFLTSSTYLFYYHYVNIPYRIAPLNTQNFEIDNERINLDEATTIYYNAIKEILTINNFKSGDPIIGLYKMPGLIYLLDGTSPGCAISPWDDLHYEMFIENLKHSKKEFKEPYFLIKNKFSDSLIIKLNTLGINFPKDYYNIGEVYIPGSRAISGTCNIYAHKNKVSPEYILAGEVSKQAFYALKTNNYKNSITLYLKALSQRPNNITDLNNLGLAYMRVLDFSNAVICFKKAVSLNPYFKLARNNLNWALSEFEKTK